MAMTHLIPKQHLKIKSPIMNTNNHFNKVFSSFDSLNKELFPDFHLVNTFSDCFSFLSVNWKNPNALTTHQNRLDNIYKNLLVNQNTMLIISDISVKNNVVTSISHIHRGQEIIAKSVHHAMSITSTEAELFTIRCRINCTIHLQDITHIIIITDAIQATKWIFNISVHLHQLHSITILKNLRNFFNENSNNLIVFWNYLDSVKWSLCLLVDKESKHLKINPISPSKSLWEFGKKNATLSFTNDRYIFKL